MARSKLGQEIEEGISAAERASELERTRAQIAREVRSEYEEDGLTITDADVQEYVDIRLEALSEPMWDEP